MFNWLRAAKNEGGAIGGRAEVKADVGRLDKFALHERKLRQGCFCVREGQVGILDATTLNPGTEYEEVIPLFVPVQEDGSNFTVMDGSSPRRVVIRCELAQLRMARYGEIPKVRREQNPQFYRAFYKD